MEPINIGVIGAGYWGPNLIRNFYGNERCSVRYVCDLDSDKLAKVKKEYPAVSVTREAQDVIAQPEIAAVVIATPVATHFALAASALSAGKHVLIEKPLAASVPECEELIALAKRRQLVLMVDHTFLYTGAVRKIKELVEEGALGDLYYFDSERINLGLIQGDVNVLWDLAPHDIAIMQHVFAGLRPVSVLASGSAHISNTSGDVAHAIIRFANGAVGHIHASWLSPIKIRKIIIGGSKKMIVYNDIEPSEKVKLYDKGAAIDFSAETPARPVYRSGDVHIPALSDEEALKREADHFLDCVAERRPPLSDGKVGLAVVKILAACDQSMREGRVILL